MEKSKKKSLFLVLGNQLFDPAQWLPSLEEESVMGIFMAEERSLATHFRYHQQKIGYFFAAMREYREELKSELGSRSRILSYHEYSGSDSRSFETLLLEEFRAKKATRLLCFEIEDRFFEERIQAFCREQGIEICFVPTPMFLTSRDDFKKYLASVKKPFMKTFYERQRKRLKILVTPQGEPVGGQWSFDEENRKKLPASEKIPAFRRPSFGPVAQAALKEVSEVFSTHPGSALELWLPVTRKGVKEQLRAFLEERFSRFGEYEDALSSRGDVLFHSALTPALNTGLITPAEVIEEAIRFSKQHKVPLNSLEGFVRQIIGWREFIRGIYQNYDEKQQHGNFWNHHRKLPASWWDASTGIPPLDEAIRKVKRLGWNHHIERLMVVGNLMLLSEIEPSDAHRWFMEMYIDSSDWVMGPNVYGMALFSDGGIFATKPYICGSNYLLKMSDTLKKGPWCDTVDGLYWSFVDHNRKFFSSNPRLSMTVRTLDRLGDERKKHLYACAAKFRETGRINP